MADQLDPRCPPELRHPECFEQSAHFCRRAFAPASSRWRLAGHSVHSITIAKLSPARCFRFAAQKPDKLRDQALKRAGAVAQVALHRGAQLAERAVIFGNQKIWIVAETVCAAGLAGKAPLAIGFDL